MRLFLLFLGISTLSGCNLTSGTSINIDATIVDINGSTIILEHDSAPELSASTQEFSIDPNLARRVTVGEKVSANIIIGENPQVIGFAAPAAH